MVADDWMQRFRQILKALPLPIETGVLIAVLNETDARQLGVWANERVRITHAKNQREITAVVDLTCSIVKENQLGLFMDSVKALDAHENDDLVVEAAEKPKSVVAIKAKMNKQKLSQEERLLKLNKVAIRQMKSLIENQGVKRLEKI